MKKPRTCKSCGVKYIPNGIAQPRCKSCEFQRLQIKYSKYQAPKFKRNLEQERVNKLVRERDFGKPCISCGKMRTLEAGHFIPISKSTKLRYDLRNIHGQCAECNRFKYGNYVEYRKGLIARYGFKFVENLEMEK